VSNKILVAGCSFTRDYSWPEVLFPTASIKNIGEHGAGNEFISRAVIDSVCTTRPDYVFLLWSGLRRIDANFSSTLDKTEFSEIPFKGKISNSVTVFSGGDWTRDAESLWKHPAIDSYFKLKYKNKDQNFLIENSTFNIMNCHNFLESQNIPYKFSFIYDIFSSYCDNDPGLGPAVSKATSYLRFVNWDKFINLTPFEYGVKHDLLKEDGFHLTDTGMNAWANEIKNYF
jgi:hypothetical protein